MGLLLFSNRAPLQIADTGPIPGTGPNLFAFDLQTSKLIGVEVSPYVPYDSKDKTYLNPDSVQNFTFGPNGDLYFIGTYYLSSNSTVQAIFKAPSNSNSYPIEFEDLKFDPPISPIYKGGYISTVRVRQVSSKSGNRNRVYFSRSSGADGDGHIYYLDDSNKPVTYYTVKLDQIPTDSTCLKYYWSGDFTFNDSGPVSENSTATLYLSNGNLTDGACIYQVIDAGLDTANGTPSRLYSSAVTTHGPPPPSAITGMQFGKDAQGLEVLYFASMYTVFELDVNTKIASAVDGFSNLSQLAPFWDVSYVDSWPAVKSIILPSSGQQHDNREPVYARFPEVPATISPTNPEPDEHTVAAQEWVQQTLTGKTNKFGLTLTLSQWSYKLNEKTTGDQVTGTVLDQYGYLHAYDVRIAKDGKIQAGNSTVE
jgi:hypothetical protein